MASNRETIEMRLKLQRARQFQRGVDRSARSVDNLGDQAAQAARKMTRLNAATGKTRLNIGPFSTSMRFAALAAGGLIMAVESAVPWVLSLGEAIVTTGAAAGGVGLAGLTALGQGALVAKLGLSDVTEAVGGNEAAIKRLAPEAQNLVYLLTKSRDALAVDTNRALFPGLEKGAMAASKNFAIIDKVSVNTAKTFGRLGNKAGTMFGSKAWGRDMATVGATNVKVIDDLGHSGMNLANVARHIVVGAGPLTEWLSGRARRGSSLLASWLGNKRESGELSRFFRDAKTDMRIIGRITGHGTRGLINLFGNQDVDGTKTLRGINRVMRKFENWTARINDKPLGPEIEKQLQKGLGAAATFLGENIGAAGATAAAAFVQSFKSADVWGKALMGAWVASKLGLTKGLFKRLGSGAAGGVAGGLGKKGISKANPVPVWVVNQGALPGGPGGKGGKSWLKRVGPLAATLGKRSAAGAAILGGGEAAITGKFPGWLPGLSGHNLSDPIIGKGSNAVIRRRSAAEQAAMAREKSRQLGGASKDIFLDAQGFPTSRANAVNVIGQGTTRPMPVVDNHVVVNIDGKPIYIANSRAAAKKAARRRARSRGAGAYSKGAGRPD